MARFIGPVAIAAGTVASLTKMISAQREFDILNAGLITATGSTQGAAVAFQSLMQFATETPYSLQQVTEAFVKLQNYGLNPSERALTSYGNTAAALGKDLSQMVEAVADAATQQFMRLREFGIRAENHGDTVAFTFAGVTETVKNNAADIEEYLIRLGEVNFAGNMENRMKTLDGAFSNLGDEVDKFWLNVSQSGFGDLIADQVRGAIEELEVMNQYMASGQLETELAQMGAAWGPWADDAQEAIQIVSTSFSNYLAEFLGQSEEQDQLLNNAWEQFPQNVRAAVQLVTTHFAWMIERIRIGMETIQGYRQAIIDGIGGITFEDINAKADAAHAANMANLRDSADAILAERDASIDASKAHEKRGQMLANVAEFTRKVREAQGDRDELADFMRDRPDEDPAATDGAAAKAAARAAETARKAQEREFSSLVASLRTQEEAIADSYQRRKAIIEQNTAEGSDARTNLMARLDEDLAKEEAALAQSQQQRIETARQGLMTQEYELAAHFQRQRDLIIANIADPTEREALLRKLQVMKQTEQAFLAAQQAEERDRLLQTDQSALEAVRARIESEMAILREGYETKLISEEEYLKRRNELLGEYNRAYADQQRALVQLQLDAGEMMFGALAELAEAYGGEQSKSFKALFAIQKAFTIASAALDIQKTISDAMAKGWPQNIPLIAQAVAQGARILTTIRGINYAGAFDKGGYIPPGFYGTVAEIGHEMVNGQLVKGPANVMSREDTASLLKTSGGTNITISVVNNGEPATARATSQELPNGDLFIEVVLNAVGDSFASGQGAPYVGAKSRFNLKDAV